MAEEGPADTSKDAELAQQIAAEDNPYLYDTRGPKQAIVHGAPYQVE